MNISPFSIILTILAASLSLLGTIIEYRVILAEKEGTVASGIIIPVKPSYIQLFQKHSLLTNDDTSIKSGQKDHCLGSIFTKWDTVPDGYELSFSGSFLSTTPVEIKGSVSFNNIGQLIGSVIQLQSEGFSIKYGTLGINPIEIIIKGEVLNQKINYNTQVAGPIELIKGSSAYTLIIPRFHQESFSNFKGLDSLKEIYKEFKIVRSTTNNSCTDLAQIEIPNGILPLLMGFQNLKDKLNP